MRAIHALVLCAVLALASAHICLMSPPQRGALNIHDAGDDTCFRHQWPCGGQAPSPAPYPTYPPDGREYYWDMEIDFQQNLNHYEVGYPGYIDISYTRKLNPTNESDFVTLYTLSDINYHMQSKQTNFTVYINNPRINCAHCILRIRYVPHKPGETTFYQCADVAFRIPKEYNPPAAQPAILDKADSRVSALLARSKNAKTEKLDDDHPHLQFLINDWWNNDASNVFTVDTVSGALYRHEFYPFGIRRRSAAKPPATSFFLDQIFAFDKPNNISYYIVHETGDWDAIPAMLVRVQDEAMHLRTLSNFTSPINGIVVLDSHTLLALMIVPAAGKAGFYQLVIAFLDPDKGVLYEMQRTAADDTFINFQWLELDPSKKFLYVLMGDENSLYELRTTLFIFDIYGNTYRTIRPNVTRYTFSAFHVQSSGEIYALSPGLHKAGAGTSSAWWLVTLDPNTGAVAPVFEISTPGLFFQHYSQAVFNCPDGIIFARLDMQDDDGLAVIATINIAARTVHFSSQTILDLAHNLAYVGS
eukprot:m.224955 g.224955  ORF g.224955 m.224955 type:complete len:530 (-) comp16590_c0_seq1:123-1712(-)